MIITAENGTVLMPEAIFHLFCLQVAVDFAIAVGLTKEQVKSGADLRSLSWLDSPAIISLLQPLNITAIPQALWSNLNGSQAIDLKGLNLSSIFPFLPSSQPLETPGAVVVPEAPLAAPAGAAVTPGAGAAVSGAGVTKGIIAAIAVTVVIAALALAGVVWLLFAKGMICKQPATVGSGGSSDSRPRKVRGRVPSMDGLSKKCPDVGNKSAHC